MTEVCLRKWNDVTVKEPREQTHVPKRPKEEVLSPLTVPLFLLVHCRHSALPWRFSSPIKYDFFPSHLKTKATFFRLNICGLATVSICSKKRVVYTRVSNSQPLILLSAFSPLTSWTLCPSRLPVTTPPSVVSSQASPFWQSQGACSETCFLASRLRRSLGGARPKLSLPHTPHGDRRSFSTPSDESKANLWEPQSGFQNLFLS